jgi:hypothetical protein
LVLIRSEPGRLDAAIPVSWLKKYHGTPRIAAMLLCGLTVDRANNPVFVRVSFI